MTILDKILRIIFWDRYLLKQLEDERELLEEALIAQNEQRRKYESVG
jgi:hypothetical protein